MSSFSRNLNHHWKYREHKENFQTIMFNSFFELYTVLVQVPFATSKTNTFQIFCQGLWWTSNNNRHIAQYFMT